MKERGREKEREEGEGEEQKDMDLWVFVRNYVYFGCLGFLVWISMGIGLFQT